MKFDSVDELILCGELRQRGLLETVGGRDSIGRLIYDTPSAAGIEGYCEAILNRARDREAIQAAGEMLSGETTLEDTARRVQELATSKGSIETSDVDELEAEVEAEIAGERRALVPPGWHRLAASQFLLPGKITVLCGSPGVSKTFFAMEPVWKWHEAGERVASLQLEDRTKDHLRRVHAQMARSGDVTNAKWCKDNPDEMRALIDQYRPRLKALKDVILCPNPTDKPTPEFLLRWIRTQCIAGTRLLVIDPITKMRTSEFANKEHENFVTDATTIINEYGVSLILVSHPKRGKPGDLLLPCLDNLPNSSAYERFCHTILWLEAIEDSVETFTINDQEIERPVNRYLHPLKTRCGPSPGRLAYYFDKKSLTHIEQGKM